MNNIKETKKKSKAITNKTKTIFELIKERRVSFQSILPQGVNADRFISACLIAVRTSPKLQQCKPESLIKSMLESARFGLEPNSPLSEAALVPYGDKVTFLIEYRGMLKLAWNSGMIKTVEADVIHENDQYEYIKGFEPKFYHKPLVSGDRGEPIAYYACAKLNNGGNTMYMMSKDEIIGHMKQYSKGWNTKASPWHTNFSAMAKKTVLRQLIDKQLPKSTTPESILLAQAAHIEDVPEEERHYVDIDPALEIQPEEFNRVATGEIKPVKLNKKNGEIEQKEPKTTPKNAKDLLEELILQGDEVVARENIEKVTGERFLGNYEELSDTAKNQIIDRLTKLLSK